MNETLLDDIEREEMNREQAANERSSRYYAIETEQEYSERDRFFGFILPSRVFEILWVSSWFYLCYMAATFLTRFIWSTLLLFIFYPDEVQVYSYFLSLFIAIWKFMVDLNEVCFGAKIF